MSVTETRKQEGETKTHLGSGIGMSVFFLLSFLPVVCGIIYLSDCMMVYCDICVVWIMVDDVSVMKYDGTQDVSNSL